VAERAVAAHEVPAPVGDLPGARVDQVGRREGDLACARAHEESVRSLAHARVGERRARDVANGSREALALVRGDDLLRVDAKARVLPSERPPREVLRQPVRLPERPDQDPREDLLDRAGVGSAATNVPRNPRTELVDVQPAGAGAGPIP
jgi:hypothetical protein